MVEVFLSLFEGVDSAVDHKFQLGKVLGQTMHDFVTQWRYVSVLLGAQSVQQAFASMYNELTYAARTHGANEVRQFVIRIHFVGADATLHTYRYRNPALHSVYDFTYQIRLHHQLGTKTMQRHSWGRTSTIQIYFTVASTVLLDNCGRFRDIFRIATTNLHNAWFFLNVLAKQKVEARTVNNSIVHDHLSVQNRLLREKPHQHAIMWVCQLHHRSNG